MKRYLFLLFRSIALYTGHAPANFAFVRVLSFKLRFTRFQQVPTGSDYPVSQSYTAEKLIRYLFFHLYSSFLFFPKTETSES